MRKAVYQLREAGTNRVVVAQLEIARSLWKQTVGLLGRNELPVGAGLWLEPCGSIHTWGMKFAIDVLFLDASGTVLRAVPSVQPWRVCWPVRRARVVVEIPAGAIERGNIREGKRYKIERID